jgi:hypothetical protein
MQRGINHLGAGLGGDLGANAGFADQPVDRLDNRAAVGEVGGLEPRRQRVEPLAGPGA